MTGETESAAARASDTPEAIMEGTYRALCRHGYAALTMQDIADESDKSKASLHYHFDTKEELLLAFLDHLYDSFTDEFGATDGETAVERLVAFVDDVLCHSADEAERDADRGDDPPEYEEFQTALLEIKAQGPYAEAYREQLERFDGFVRRRVHEIVTDGIEEGTIRADVDPDDTADFVATLIDGVNTRRVAIGETDGSTRSVFVAYVRDHLVAPGADVVVDPADERANGEPTQTAAEGDD